MLENLNEELTVDDVSGILQEGGSILGSSRTNPFTKDDGPEQVKNTLAKNNLDALIAMGGDDTLGVTKRLNKGYDLGTIGIPQTIDNDVAETEFAIGFITAIQTVTDAVDKLRTTAFTHHRVMILEVMGRDAGWLGLIGGIAGGADNVLVPEEEFAVSDIKERIQKRTSEGREHSVVVISEGATPKNREEQVLQESETDEFGHARLGGVGHYLADELREVLDLPVRATVLGYLQRGGNTAPFDRLLATRFGVKAVELAIDGEYGKMTARKGDEIVPVPLEDALSKQKPIEPDMLELANIFY
jgi:6-phosphofructokinase 1